MVSIKDIKKKAKELKKQREQPNDQLEARKQRAAEKARKEALKEKRQQEVEEAKEQAKESARIDNSLTGRITDAISTAADAVDDGDGERFDDIATAMQTDFDGDGEPLGAEMGFQTQARADEENQTLSALGERVDRNRSDIDEIDQQLGAFGGGSSGGESQAAFGSSADEYEQLKQMGFDPDDNLGLGGDD